MRFICSGGRTEKVKTVLEFPGIKESDNGFKTFSVTSGKEMTT
jgi:hypothetical protein